MIIEELDKVDIDAMLDTYFRNSVIFTDQEMQVMKEMCTIPG